MDLNYTFVTSHLIQHIAKYYISPDSEKQTKVTFSNPPVSFVFDLECDRYNYFD